jgi:ribonuclease Z
MGGDARFSVTFLGTRDAAVRPGVHTSSQLVSLGESDVLVDAGLGASAQLRAVGLATGALEAIVLTHWHPDHVAGLPTLLRRGAGSFGSRSDLRLLGPPPPAESWWRALRWGSLWPLVSRLDVVEPGETLELGSLRLETFATDHGTSSLGWRFSEQDGGDRVAVIPGDSRPTEEIVAAAAGADLLVFEATFLDRDAERARASRHSTAFEAGTLARDAGVGTLALTHLSSRYPLSEVEAEAQLAFGQVLVPHDLDRAEIAPRSGAFGAVTRGRAG